MTDPVELLKKVAKARADVATAEKMNCTCSGFILQYEGGCMCSRGREISKAEYRLESALKLVDDYLG